MRDPYGQNPTLVGVGGVGWGAITLGPHRGHFGPEGEPYGQNLDPRGWGGIKIR